MRNPCIWCCLVLLTLVVCDGCLHEERRHLMEICDTFHWSDGWDWPDWSSRDCCQWERVTFSSSTGRVTALDLSADYSWWYNDLLNCSMFLPFHELQNLSLRNVGIAGCVPGAGFEVLSNLRQLQILDLSENELNDSSIMPLDGLASLHSLFLSGNVIKNAFIVQRLSKVKLDILDLSWNGIFGKISRAVCNMTSLRELHLNGNFFFGLLPSCIRNLTFLRVLDLSNNLLTARSATPKSFSNHLQLKYLRLSSNSANFRVQTENPAANISSQLQVELSNCNLNANSGVVPSFLSHQHGLYLIDVSNNNLSGHFPMWLLENNIYLSYLSVKHNSFVGTLILPSKVNDNLSWLDASCNRLCRDLPVDINITFPNLSHLNLSKNCFQGKHVPRDDSKPNVPLEFFSFQYGDTLVNVTANLSNTLHEIFQIGVYREFNSTMLELDQEEFTTKGRQDYYKGNILSYMSGLDFSSNQLEGPIPESIGDIVWLRALNFSHNSFSGPVPISLSNLSNLESLDLSHNRLNGQLSPQLAGLKSFEVFSVAYNNLSGPTLRTRGQFITFGQSSYESNPYLCGAPLLNSCSTVPTPSIPQHEQDVDDDDDKVGDVVLFCGTALFYVIGFWTSLAVLFFRRSWRCALFLAVDRFSDPLMFRLAMLSRRIRSTS
uniref:Leucine-rich repeat-containing N-terminal plant-type domain-containing protein n=1 Tax=Oryza punctata TaxID=4537 RepID=A0A0E0L8K0_ORYPU